MRPQFPAGLFRNLPAGKIIDQLQGPVAHVIGRSLIIFPAFQPVYDPAPVRGTVRQKPDGMLHLLKFLLFLTVVALFQFCLDIDQPVSQRCQLILYPSLPLQRLF